MCENTSVWSENRSLPPVYTVKKFIKISFKNHHCPGQSNGILILETQTAIIIPTQLIKLLQFQKHVKPLDPSIAGHQTIMSCPRFSKYKNTNHHYNVLLHPYSSYWCVFPSTNSKPGPRSLGNVQLTLTGFCKESLLDTFVVSINMAPSESHTKMFSLPHDYFVRKRIYANLMSTSSMNFAANCVILLSFHCLIWDQIKIFLGEGIFPIHS